MAFQTTEISRTGDIVLVVGEDTKTALRLRVESYMLRRASKAFDVMFGPRFGEGQNITASNPKDIPLPEDDPDMMKLVCHILHFQSSVVPGTICASDTYKLAKLVDKYFLHDAVRLALDRAFNIEASMLSADRIQLLRAAILLQNDDYYKVVTKSMIMECNGPYSGLYNEDGEEFTVEDHSLASALEVERSRLRIVMNQAIYNVMAATIKHNWCSCLSTYRTKLEETIRDLHLTPYWVSRLPLGPCVQATKHLCVPAFNACSGNGDHTLPASIRQELHEPLRPIRDYNGMAL